MLLTLASFALVLGVLIFVHELGHFIAAKLMGIGVPRFSIGFGPPTPLRFTHGETEYVLAWFPVGGYVKMASREEQETETHELEPLEQTLRQPARHGLAVGLLKALDRGARVGAELAVHRARVEAELAEQGLRALYWIAR